MTKLNLTPNHKSIRQYYEIMHEKKQMGFQVEGNVAPAFADLLGSCARTLGYRLNEQHPLKVKGRNLRLDAAILNLSNLRMGVWEAEDTQDDLKTEIRKKFDSGYPNDNILFQSPQRAILIQNGQEVLDVDLNEPNNLINILNAFFSYTKPAVEEWEAAVAQFKDEVPEVASGLDKLIEQEYTRNGAYKAAFDSFFALCKTAINPNLSKDAVEEMLIQHILTERIFRRVFNNDKFTRQNAIARDIETVIDALTSKVFNRDDFTRSLDHFYGAIEHTASTISDYNEKQDFLNTVYEQFFQGFSVKVSDTHGIVYTPQAIVQFMVKSVEDLLRREFGRSLVDEGVHILDPFVGTGNFLLRVMEEIRTIKPSALPQKYANELHCNEIMLLPYYIASMNLEHAYYDAMGEYAPFEGICLVDTFELAEERQLPMFVEANTARVERQRKSELTVILGNPPYNSNQLNENDNNKNRKYKVLDKRVAETYAKASAASNRRHLSDPYVKAFRWASDRLKDEGIVAFVTNNGFLDNIAFDGMRQWLAREFSAIYHLDFKGNARTSGERRRREGGNVFSDLIRVGVGITFLVKRKDYHAPAKIYMYRVDDYLKAPQKMAVVEGKALDQIPLTVIQPDKNNVWLTVGMQDDYETLLPLGTKDAKRGKGQAIFGAYSLGVSTNRDIWAYNFRQDELEKNIQKTIETYNLHVLKWRMLNVKPNLDDFVENDDTKISWSRDLKLDLKRGHLAEFNTSKIRRSLYRPFTTQNVYFDKILNEEVYQFPHILPTPETEAENRVIIVGGYGRKEFAVSISNVIPNLNFYADPAQCFPLYVYEAHTPSDTKNRVPTDDVLQTNDPVGTAFLPSAANSNNPTLQRRDNISDWALSQFQAHYGDTSITKQNIFYYIYALLHHPEYRRKYAQNLKRELPRIGFLADFSTLADIGRKLADLHLNYESAPCYPLTERENKSVPVSYRVEKKMALSKDKTSLKVNDFLTLEGIPTEAFSYKLGNRSALEWVIEQYQVSTDKRSGITNDPNRLDDEPYIVRLVTQVIHVSIETTNLVNQIATIPLT